MFPDYFWLWVFLALVVMVLGIFAAAAVVFDPFEESDEAWTDDAPWPAAGVPYGGWEDVQ